MRVVIAGGHGQIALRLERLLAARGDEAYGLIRDPGQSDDLRRAGARPVVCDLESATVPQVVAHLTGADAVVFAAGAGPGSGAGRKDTSDRGGAVLLADAAEQAGVRRYLMVSAIGASNPPPASDDSVWAAYLRAKAAADDDLRRRDLDWTILRPGGLTNDPGTGLVNLAERTGRGSIPRDDVASVLLAMLSTPETAGLMLELVSGTTPIDAAIRSVVPGS